MRVISGLLASGFFVVAACALLAIATYAGAQVIYHPDFLAAVLWLVVVAICAPTGCLALFVVIHDALSRRNP